MEAVVLTLSIIEGPDQGKSFQIPMDEPQLIGRSSEALPITDTTVSRRHAELTPDSGRWFLRDLQSQNHTYLNGVLLVTRAEIRDGDQIRVGSTVFQVGEDERGAASYIEFVGSDRIDTDIEERMASNEDSMVLAEPEPIRAAVDHLRVIYQLTKLTTQVTQRQELLERLLDLVFSEFHPQRGVVMLVPPGHEVIEAAPLPEPGTLEVPAEGDVPIVGEPPPLGFELVPAAVKYETPPSDDDEARIEVSRTILHLTVREGEGVLSSNAQADPRFAKGDSVAQYNIRSAICSPIKFGEKTFGAVYIDSSIANYTFTAEQLALLNAIGQHAGLALANAEQTSKRLETERLAAIGETIASLSHSIKNILQGLRGGADVVEMGLKKGNLAVSASGWEILKRNLDRIVSLSMNMLTFSRQRHIELVETNIGRLMEDCRSLVEESCKEKSIALIFDVEAEMPPVALDPDLMHQAIMNLLTNAVAAAPQNTGVVTARAIYHEPGPHNPRLLRPMLEIIVADNGPGIPKDKLRKVFEPFYTTKGLKGTGLGLAVTKRILSDHTGRVRVETAENKGAAFRLILPADLTPGDEATVDGGALASAETRIPGVNQIPSDPRP